MKVLVIGETCVDRFVYCDAKRLSPEAPVPVLTPSKTIENPGMAGNTYENVKALIPKAVMASISQKAKITKTRYVEEKSNHMFLRVDEGEDFDCQFMWGPFSDSSLAEADIVIVSDYNKGFLSNADLKEIARKSTLSILDSKRKLTDDIIKGFTFVKLNEQERTKTITSLI
jgi:bifunctional ADP-heptose synthase (sugar kinase/adenylyltransferase)